MRPQAGEDHARLKLGGLIVLIQLGVWRAADLGEFVLMII